MPLPNEEGDDDGMATFEREKEKAIRERGSTGPVGAASPGEGSTLAMDAFEKEHEKGSMTTKAMANGFAFDPDPKAAAASTKPGAVNVVSPPAHLGKGGSNPPPPPPTQASEAEARFRSKQLIQNPQLISTVGGSSSTGSKLQPRYEGYIDPQSGNRSDGDIGSKRQSRYEGYLHESDERSQGNERDPATISLAAADNRPGAYPYQPATARSGGGGSQGADEEEPRSQPQEEAPSSPRATTRPLRVVYDDPGQAAGTTPPPPTEQQDGGDEDSGNGGLAVAQMVDSSPLMVQADEVDPEDLTRQRTNNAAATKTKQFLWGTIAVVVLFVVALTLILVVFTSPSKAMEEEFNRPTTNLTESENSIGASASLSPEEQKQKLQNVLPVYTLEAIEQDDSSPQSLAFRWLLNDTDHFHLYPDWRLFQRYILATVFFSTGGPTSWRKSQGWLDYNLHECKWFSQATMAPPGITQPYLTYPDGRPYYPHQHVCNIPPDTVPNLTLMDDIAYTDLWLWANNLEGDLPREIFALPSLRSLALMINPSLTGAITSDIGQLSDLLGWSISKTGLSFTIPTEIGLARNFVMFHALWSGVHGTLPTELGSLNMTQWLRIDESQITGTIPSQLGKLPSLERLLLGKNSITGTVPTQLGQLSRLRWLDLSNTELTGTLPSEIGLLSSLEVLRLERSQFSGSVPSEILALSNLVAQNLTGNEQLTGEVPAITCADVRDLGFYCSKYM